MNTPGPNIADIRAVRDQLSSLTVCTPVLRCPLIEDKIGGNTEVFSKLEFLQRTGTFKARGALATIMQLDAGQLAAGVTAASAGNHAIATAYAAKAIGTTAKVVMTRNANPSRITACKS